jgi:hypothetical protein
MGDEKMFGLVAIVVVFAALAYDLTSNYGARTTSVFSFASNLMADLRHLLHV